MKKAHIVRNHLLFLTIPGYIEDGGCAYYSLVVLRPWEPSASKRIPPLSLRHRPPILIRISSVPLFSSLAASTMDVVGPTMDAGLMTGATDQMKSSSPYLFQTYLPSFISTNSPTFIPPSAAQMLALASRAEVRGRYDCVLDGKPHFAAVEDPTLKLKAFWSAEKNEDMIGHGCSERSKLTDTPYYLDN
ncbi:hypothetical protein D9613_012909 [Agrocybe pediades]|uniref:Uncharacterized protein n=1 Tax=Agrocybe pediades TaxID=84607 RepID=A0A8H4QQY2_9AGAR|nr:hypothetical protein D9613_012909 [Agrocybe pediades]